MPLVRLVCLFLALVLFFSPVHAEPLNDTGQLRCFDETATPTGTVSPATPDPEAAGFDGQDCTGGASAADALGVQVKLGGSDVSGRDYTKIAADGSQLPDTATWDNGAGDWRCTRDNVTGLLWLLRTNDGDILDKDHRYSFGDNANSEGNTCGGSLTTCQTDPVVQTVNAFDVCGVNNWDVPTPRQLESLLAFNDPVGTENLIDRTWFPDQTNDSGNQFIFWSRQPQDEFNPPSYWVADFAFGAMTFNGAESPAYLRLVSSSSAAVANRFTTSAPDGAAPSDVVVEDADTGLMWKQCPQGLSGTDCATGTRSIMTWSAALTAAQAESFAGFEDWRLPTITELASIRDYAPVNFGTPALAAQFAGTGDTETYWSATNEPRSSSLTTALTYQFQASAAQASTFKTQSTAVRLVRAGSFLGAYRSGDDTTPDAFSFAAKDAPAGTLVESNEAITVAGITAVTSLKVTGAAQSAFSINGGSWSSGVGGVRNGDTVRLRHQAAATVGNTATTTLNIGGVTADFTSTATATPPDAPSDVVATRGDASASLTFSAPASDGGSEITGYTAISDPAGGTSNCEAPPSTACSVTGLTNGTSYTFTVTATNAVGTSDPSAPSSAVTPATVPDAPTNAAATAGIGEASVSFDEPSDGGSPITGYTATSSPGGVTGTCNASPCVVTGLSNGATYSFTVTASNNVGTSASSSASNSVTLPNTPGAPTDLTASGSDGVATISFTAPSSTGGSPIIDYTATSSPGGLTGTCADSPCSISGLAAGTTYTFTVRARNDVGEGPASSPSNDLRMGASPTIAFQSTPREEYPLNHNAGWFILFSDPDFKLVVDDEDSALEDLTVTVASSNHSLLPPDDLYSDGVSVGRFSTDTPDIWRSSLRPAYDETGSATIVYTVTDPNGLSASTPPVTVTVIPGNKIPRASYSSTAVRLPENATPGEYVVPGFLFDATPGAGEEAAQVLTHGFYVSEDDPGGFINDRTDDVNPRFDPMTGDLIFTLPSDRQSFDVKTWPRDDADGIDIKCSDEKAQSYALFEIIGIVVANLKSFPPPSNEVPDYPPPPGYTAPCGEIFNFSIVPPGQTRGIVALQRPEFNQQGNVTKTTGGSDDALSYRIVLNNNGSLPINGARIEVPVPRNFRVQSWACQTEGAPCEVTNGTGPVDTRVDLQLDELAIITILGHFEEGAAYVGFRPKVTFAEGVDGFVLGNDVEIIDAVSNDFLFANGFEGPGL